MPTATHPVDEMLPAPQALALGLQHVLVMYAGAVAVPLIVGRALQALARAGGVPDLGRPVLLRHRHDPDPVARRHAVVRHQAAGDDGRHLRRRRPDGRDAPTPIPATEGARMIFGAIIARRRDLAS